MRFDEAKADYESGQGQGKIPGYADFENKSGKSNYPRQEKESSSKFLDELANLSPLDLAMPGLSLSYKLGKAMGKELAQLFDGDKPLEIVPDKNEQKKQDWLIAMNLATDFSGDCSIEKRSAKLKELAKSTEGKNVSIVVQSTSKTEKGDYKLARFIIKDGKVQELKSPGAAKGYGDDVESLIKFATGSFPSKNFGLILDSHGEGNEGLTGDIGKLSMADFGKHVKNGLKASGHEKLDFLQFDCCLMAQNGVLESVKDIAKHVVASAEPQGVNSDTAAADNKNLEKLLKDPAMSAAKLAEICVSEAKDVKGFDTLAHFDMEKYGAFRKSLDSFGDELAKAMENKEQAKSIQEIIKQTFQYGGGGFTISGHVPAILYEHMKRNPQAGFGHESQSNDNSMGSYFQAAFDTITGGLFKPHERPALPRPHLGEGDGAPERPGKPYHFLERPFLPFSRHLGSGKRDLKDFAEKLIKAIDDGKIKDEKGKLKEAAQAVLKDGEALTRSYFGRNERKALGGLSVFLPAEGERHDAASISDDGGWRKFQKLLKEASAKPKAEDPSDIKPEIFRFAF